MTDFSENNEMTLTMITFVGIIRNYYPYLHMICLHFNPYQQLIDNLLPVGDSISKFIKSVSLIRFHRILVIKL